jgi:hypothetical protein
MTLAASRPQPSSSTIPAKGQKAKFNLIQILAKRFAACRVGLSLFLGERHDFICCHKKPFSLQA